MKLNYESPMITVELFTPNQAIAQCTANQEAVLQCIQGTSVHTWNIFSSGAGTDTCKLNAGFAEGIYKAKNADSGGSTIGRNTKNWTWKNNVATYTPGGTTGATGLVYICLDNNGRTNITGDHTWEITEDTIVHTNGNKREHCEIGVVTTSVSLAS